jgi:hypothetical protein
MAVTVVSLVALQALAGAAGAATTRHIYIGYDANALDKSVASADLVGDHNFSFTDVTAGGAASSSLYIRNVDNQTLTHVVVTIPQAQGTASVAEVFNGDSGKCSLTAATETVPATWSCDFGNLKAGATKWFSMLFQTTTAATNTITGAKVTFNESNNPNGGNVQIEAITGALTVAPATCNLAQTYLRSGRTTSVTDATDCALSDSNPQSTSVSLAASSNSPIIVQETSVGLCAAGATCFGQESVADVAVNGDYVVTWTIQWKVASNFNLNQLVIYHFADGATASTAPDQTLTYKKNICKTPNSSDCIVSAGVVGTTLTAIIRTTGNGSMRGGS